MAGMFDDLIPKQPDQKGGMFDDLVPQYDEKSTMQSIFDLIDPKTGKSIIYGNTPDPGPTEDYRRIARDAITRGYGDKALGPEAQAKTEASRERTPGYIETPLEIASTLAASPYAIGGPFTGAAFGAGEGALRSYGNQEGWVPEWGDIHRDAMAGAALGAGGAALPGVWNATKTGLGKVGNVSKLLTGGLDILTTGLPWATGTKYGAKVLSKIPALPTGDVTRDALSKAMISQGPR